MSRWPLVVEYLQATQWDDGTARQTATLSIFHEMGLFKVWVNDRDLRRTCCVSAPTLGDLLDRLELGLAGEPLDWRPMRERGSRR